MTARQVICWMALTIGGGVCLPGNPARGQDLPVDSLSGSFRAAIGDLTTPEHQQRIANRRKMQRGGYADVLFHSMRSDGLWGITASLRSTLQLDYFLPREPLVIFVPIRQPERRNDHLPGFTGAPSPPMAIPLWEDRSFPVDPWAKR